jgi:hypothetical protein
LKKVFLAVLMFVTSLAFAQQTVLTVPSIDVLDNGKAYVRLDTSFNQTFEQAAFAPNLIYGVGHNVEAGVNLESFSYPDNFTTSIVPNVKYRYDGFVKSGEGIALTFGDKVYIPVHNRTFNAGNFLYGTATLIVDGGLRIGGGIYNQENAFLLHNHTGALLTFEKSVLYRNGRNILTAALDWQSGRGSNGATNVGVMWFPTKKLMVIPSYQIGNYGASSGNHGPVVYVGFNLN